MTLIKSAFSTKTTYNPITKIWSGPKTPIKYGPEYSIGKAVLEALLRDPDHIEQICYHNDKKYTNQEIATLSIRVAQHFEKMHLPQCTMIGICAANSDFITPLFYGAMLAGFTVSTLDPSFEKDGIKHIYSVTRPKLMFCDGTIYKKINEALEECNLDCKIYTVRDHIAGVSELTDLLAETGYEMDFKPAPLQHGFNQTAAVLCSSGTTGLPKGVRVSHGSLLNAVIFNLYEDDIMIYFSTLYWLSGVVCLILATLGGCTRVINANGFSPEAFFDMIEKYKVNKTFTPPSQIALSVASDKIANYDLSSLTTYLTGGSAIPSAVVEKIKPYLRNALFIAGYGMSEFSSAVTIGEFDENCSNGQIGNNFEIKIINIDGEQLEPGKVGEVCMRSPFKWAGYYRNPKATAQILDKDGWIHSGDLGYISNEGNLYIIDRIKEILKYNNYHFYPSEIEKVISEIPGVSEVCVCGLPDIVSTYLPTAAIVKSPGSTVTELEIFEYVAKKMDHFKQLRGGIYFLDSLPKTASGKNLRRQVVNICEDLRAQNKI